MDVELPPQDREFIVNYVPSSILLLGGLHSFLLSSLIQMLTFTYRVTVKWKRKRKRRRRRLNSRKRWLKYSMITR